MLLKEAKQVIKPANGNTKMNCGCWGLPISTCTIIATATFYIALFLYIAGFEE